MWTDRLPRTDTLALFEGAPVLHRVTGLGRQQVRIQLSMAFCSDPGASWHEALARRGEDVAYFGIRALWT
jgi:hypothetical protein